MYNGNERSSVRSLVLFCPVCLNLYRWDSLLVRAPDSRSKGCEFESQQERQENSPLQGQLCMLTLIWCLFHPRVTTGKRERSLSFCQKCSGRLQPNEVILGCLCLSRRSVGTSQGNTLTCNSSGNTQPQSSQLTEPLRTDPGLKSGICVH